MTKRFRSNERKKFIFVEVIGFCVIWFLILTLVSPELRNESGYLIICFVSAICLFSSNAICHLQAFNGESDDSWIDLYILRGIWYTCFLADTCHVLHYSLRFNNEATNNGKSYSLKKKKFFPFLLFSQHLCFI